jgi:site-specific DNA-methyltransferase (adenine-specific)
MLASFRFQWPTAAGRTLAVPRKRGKKPEMLDSSAPMAQSGALFYGDNLEILRHHVGDEEVDLVYLDPPFNSNASYNVLFAEQDGSRAASQIKAFEDTWRWDQEAANAFEEVVEAGGEVSNSMQAFRTILSESNMLAYLAMMAPRLVELHRTLKETGSLYLHCDPTASHYLKILLDAVFGPKGFKNEIVWKRTSAHNDAKRFGRIHDVLLYYVKDPKKAQFTRQYRAYDPAYIQAEWRRDSNGRWFKLENLTAPLRGSKGQFEFHGRTPGANRMWRFNKEGMEKLWNEGRIRTDKDGVPLRRGHLVYLEDMPGMPLQDIWDDILRIGNTAKERLGYPTQKPEALLERIIESSSSEGDLVLDPFCGCGTTVAAAEKLNRRWMGIDVTYQATNLIKSRLMDAFGDTVPYTVVGEPTTTEDARRLAQENPDQFEAWALGLVGARNAAKKKGSDRGIDGRLIFHEKKGGKTRQVLISVKAGKTGVAHVRDLRGVIEREEAEIGVLITMREPTQPMRAEATSAGFYRSGSEGVGTWGKHPRIQLLTVSELLDGKRIDMPPLSGSLTFRRAPKVERRQPTTEPLFRNVSTPPELKDMFPGR